MSKKRVNIEDYYSGLNSMPLRIFGQNLKRKNKCRACLQDGDMPLTGATNHNEMIEALNIIGNIEIDGSEEDPPYLCYVCYKFLKSAILFRKVAHRTNETLLKHSRQHLDNYYDDDLETYEFEDNKPNRIDSTKDFKCKEEPVKKGTKLQCPICKKLFVKGYFNIHMKLHNPNLPDKYVCDICGKGFKFKRVYSSHMERHETRYIFKCELCPFVGRYKERLSNHMRVHTGELKFLCTQCPARYVTRGRLNKHIKLKHKEPQYKCDACDKAYHSSLNLQRHIEATHLKIKKYQCDVCGTAFGYRSDMLKHQRRVHNRANLKSRYIKSAYKRVSNNNIPEDLDTFKDELHFLMTCTMPGDVAQRTYWQTSILNVVF